MAARFSGATALLNKVAVGSVVVGVAGYCINESMYTGMRTASVHAEFLAHHSPS